MVKGLLALLIIFYITNYHAYTPKPLPRKPLTQHHIVRGCTADSIYWDYPWEAPSDDLDDCG